MRGRALSNQNQTEESAAFTNSPSRCFQSRRSDRQSKTGASFRLSCS